MRPGPDRRPPHFWPRIYDEEAPTTRRPRKRSTRDASEAAVSVLSDAARRLERLEGQATGDARLAIEEARGLVEEARRVAELGRPGLLRQVAGEVQGRSVLATRDTFRVGPDGLARMVQGGT